MLASYYHNLAVELYKKSETLFDTSKLAP